MSFDRLAPHYTWLEKVLAGNKLQLCRTAFLERMANAKSILLLGEGHGRFLPALLRANATARILCLDQSARMLKLAHDRLLARGLNTATISFEVQDIFEFQTAQTFDAIATHFFLDCFTEDQLGILVRKTTGLLRIGGIWNVADFQVPNGFFRGARARFVLALAYAFFRFATRLPGRRIVNPSPYMEDSGLRRIARKEFNFSLLYSELWEKPPL
jgi:ubiquinone/menaquinone biosynthesis C-methylase UbiE